MQVPSKSGRIPSVILRAVDATRIAVRFQQLGDRQRFNAILQRFRADFLLATCEVLEDQPWWILAATQHEELVAFCRRNGLALFNEGSKG